MARSISGRCGSRGRRRAFPGIATLAAAAALSSLPVPPAAGGAAQAAWFADATEASGIPPLKYGEGASFFDLDGDGLPELFLPNVNGRDRLFANRGGCRFEDATDASGLREAKGIGGVFGDLDGDGRADLYVVRGAYPYGTNVLLLGGPGGVFRDASRDSGAAGPKNGISAVLGDADGDGRLDIFVSNWGTNALYLSRGVPGRPRFEDRAAAAGLAEPGRSWAALFSDVDGDGRPDLVVARGRAGGAEGAKLYRNRGGASFEDRSASSGLAGAGWSMSVVAADFDGDGDPDLFFCGFDGRNRLFRNDGAGRFADVTDRSGIRPGRAVGGAAGDIDGDLLPDLVVAGFDGPVTVYRNAGGMRFEEPREGSGVGPWTRNEGVVLADVDEDGDLDLYVANYDGKNRLYRNRLDDGRYLKVRLDAGGGPLFGAAARLYRAGGLGDPGALLASGELHGGAGFCTQGPPEFLFRLPGDGPYDLLVTFPGGAAVAERGVAPGRRVVRLPGPRP